MAKEFKIDGAVYDLPRYGETERDRISIKALYKTEFGQESPENSAYKDIYFALEMSRPI